MKNMLYRKFLIVTLVLSVGLNALSSFVSHIDAAANCSQVSQYGVTYTFDKAYPCGNFANGDFWVSPNAGDAGVTITAISPAAANGRNGWEVNPSSRFNLAYDDRLSGYNASLMPPLPYLATGDKSIVKTISVPTGDVGCAATSDPCIDTAVVLTVLATQPPNNGSNIFRPPYYGNVKRLFTTAQLQTSLLPTLSPVAGAPTLQQVKDRFQRVQLDDQENYTSRPLHPKTSFFKIKSPTTYSDYGSDLSNDNSDAALRLMLNDASSAKMPALINYVQAGIDWYGIKKGGMNWYATGGHQEGRKLPIAFAAVMLDDTDMKSVVHDAPYNTFSEDGHVYWSQVANNGKGMALFGAPCDPGDYENNQASSTGSGSRDCRDPSGQIDGGQAPGDWYQYCCTVKNYEYTSLAVRLMPDVRSVWNYEPLHEYIDRWMDHGTWSKPDPSNRTTGILSSGGRVLAASLDGTGKGEGGYSSDFGDAMWATYRSDIDNWYAGYVNGSSTATYHLAQLNILISHFGLTSGQTSSTGDVNGDGAVNVYDLGRLLADYSP